MPFSSDVDRSRSETSDSGSTSSMSFDSLSVLASRIAVSNLSKASLASSVSNVSSASSDKSLLSSATASIGWLLSALAIFSVGWSLLALDSVSTTLEKDRDDSYLKNWRVQRSIPDFWRFDFFFMLNYGGDSWFSGDEFNSFFHFLIMDNQNLLDGLRVIIVSDWDLFIVDS